MSERTGKKRAGFGIIATALTVTALAVSGCVIAPSVQAADPAPAATSAPVAATAPAAPAPAPAPAPAAAHAATAAPAANDPTRIAAGRELFGNWGCNACHTLADAKASGSVGPSLDGDANLTEQFIVSRVTDGQGAMPGFGGQLTEKEIADLAYYLTKVSAK